MAKTTNDGFVFLTLAKNPKVQEWLKKRIKKFLVKVLEKITKKEHPEMREEAYTFLIMRLIGKCPVDLSTEKITARLIFKDVYHNSMAMYNDGGHSETFDDFFQSELERALKNGYDLSTLNDEFSKLIEAHKNTEPDIEN